MKKNRIRLTESQLHKVIKESVMKVLRESFSPLSPKEIGKLVASAREYESGDIEIWADENCPDEIYPHDWDTITKIWLKAHREDIPYFTND